MCLGLTRNATAKHYILLKTCRFKDVQQDATRYARVRMQCRQMPSGGAERSAQPRALSKTTRRLTGMTCKSPLASASWEVPLGRCPTLHALSWQNLDENHLPARSRANQMAPCSSEQQRARAQHSQDWCQAAVLLQARRPKWQLHGRTQPARRPTTNCKLNFAWRLFRSRLTCRGRSLPGPQFQHHGGTRVQQRPVQQIHSAARQVHRSTELWLHIHTHFCHPRNAEVRQRQAA